MSAKGVVFSTTGGDTQTKSWYLDNGVPSVAATETNVFGAGGTFNQPAGHQTVTASRA